MSAIIKTTRPLPVPATRPTTRPTTLAAALKPVVSQKQVVLICDTSASMADRDAARGQRRIDALRGVVQELARTHPRIRYICFSDRTRETGPALMEPGGSTDMAAAINFAASFVAGLTVCLISDGEPNDEAATLEAARRFPVPVQTFYVGPEGGAGEAFLRRLAAATGGQHATASLKDPARVLVAVKQRLALASGG